MARMLPKLCELYIQDFDLIFQEPTDPIDMFCQQHDLEDQEALRGVKAGGRQVQR